MGLAPDFERYSSWQEWRRRLRICSDEVLSQELKRLGEDVRDIAAIAATVLSRRDASAVNLDLADAVAIFLCGVANLDPLNSEWSGRDRILLEEGDNLLIFCAALARMGFFSPGATTTVIEKAMSDESFSLPGVELTPGGTTLATGWEMAVEARNEKLRWLAAWLDTSWADPVWRDSPVGWRVFSWLSWRDPAMDGVCSLPTASEEVSAGFTALITAPYEEATRLAELWRELGWDAFVVSRDDRLGLYQTLSRIPEEKPMAVFIGVGEVYDASRRDHEDTKLLGEMTDEQFHAVMDEYFNV